MQKLPGFRDFLPDDCAVRNYIFARWREVARRYGFVEWEGPILEPTELYKKKSGSEIVDQLFNFTDKGEREVAMRPELTPTLARVVAAHEREFKKPLKWFSIGRFFRFEKQQRGRLREHFQLNCDIVGESSVAADAELVALVVDLLRDFALTEEDFVVRLSSRDVWLAFLANKIKAFNEPELRRFFEIVDKIDRQEETKTAELLQPFSTSIDEIRDWVKSTRDFLLNPKTDRSQFEGTTLGKIHELLHDHLGPRHIGPYLDVDFTVVRGLAYYTGIVFEVFDRKKKLRAIAGGGRYDNLIRQLSGGGVSMPALGFAMGDVVIGDLINEVPRARLQMHNETQKDLWIQIYAVIAKEERRPDALAQIQLLRDAGYRVDYPLRPEKVGKQFQTAEQLGATFAVVFGDEWPQLKVKKFSTRQETLIPHDQLLNHLPRPE
ncbi:MAG: histidine--tRNA ligase [Verrucomicrobia bacterium]|nr:MAG: histidine--tRNA ligase [Verrucomicrobiota bacterium]